MTKKSKGSSETTGVRRSSEACDRLEIPSSLDYLPQVDAFVEGRLKKLGIDKSQIYDIAIAVSELVTNAVTHGNKHDQNKKVKIGLKADSSRVEVTVEDEGPGFERGEVCSPVDDENLLKAAGRGLHIVESLMDEVTILCGADGGTLVRIVKSVG
jgi:anti-sigma regulatory factor (Ser/Thr protein kinase)